MTVIKLDNQSKFPCYNVLSPTITSLMLEKAFAFQNIYMKRYNCGRSTAIVKKQNKKTPINTNGIRNFFSAMVTFTSENIMHVLKTIAKFALSSLIKDHIASNIRTNERHYFKIFLVNRCEINKLNIIFLVKTLLLIEANECVLVDMDLFHKFRILNEI